MQQLIYFLHLPGCIVSVSWIPAYFLRPPMFNYLHIRSKGIWIRNPDTIRYMTFQSYFAYIRLYFQRGEYLPGLLNFVEVKILFPLQFYILHYSVRKSIQHKAAKRFICKLLVRNISSILHLHLFSLTNLP